MDLSLIRIKHFQDKILHWYSQNKRDLPWRRVPFDTRYAQRDPYKILVSEVMLQQTQVQRVIPKYEAWLKRFPDVQSLAEASTAEVLQYWSGLGYNRRALYLRECAREIIKGKGLRGKGKRKKSYFSRFGRRAHEAAGESESIRH